MPIQVFALDLDPLDDAERARALQSWLARRERDGPDVQVLQEFFVTVTRKVAQPLSIADAADRVRVSAWKVFSPGAEDVHGRHALHRQAQIPFWDAMVSTPPRTRCDVLWTEDLAAISARGSRPPPLFRTTRPW